MSITTIVIIWVGCAAFGTALRVFHDRAYQSGYKTGRDEGWFAGQSAGYKVARSHAKRGIPFWDDEELDASSVPYKAPPAEKRIPIIDRSVIIGYLVILVIVIVFGVVARLINP